METKKGIIEPPSVTKDAENRLLQKMYISNVSKRLRELNAPSDIDRKRWIWELIQNAKDSIIGDPNRKDVDVRIDVDGDTVRFRHNGNPFTAESRCGLLYKYSEDKENQESTGRFGTGFLTTHCLSKIVSIESNMYLDKEHTQICGFSVTMYRDGQIDKELLEGLEKMRASEKYYERTFDWTTFTYHISSESGRKAVRLGIENFHENIAQTMLFCKELASIELNDNGKITSFVRKPVEMVAPNIFCAEFIINGDIKLNRRFIYTSYSEHNDSLSERYRADRSIRIDAAIEIDANNNIVNNGGKTSHFCVFPLVGIENQLNEPIIINSPDFESDSERQSLLLIGQKWNEESNNITETGINQLIYERIFLLYEMLVKYLSKQHYGKLYLLANGLKKSKKHSLLDSTWYTECVIKKYREILLKYPLVEPYMESEYKMLTECIFVNETKVEDENSIFTLLSSLYPSQLAKDNHEWVQYVWKDGLQLWNTKDLCIDIEKAKNWNIINTRVKDSGEWFNSFLKHVTGYNELLLKEYSLLPNMNGDLLKKDYSEFKQGDNVPYFIINLLEKLGKDVKPFLLHNDISTVSLEAKYTSQNISADLNKLTKKIINNGASKTKLLQLMPLLSVIPTNNTKYSEEFIKHRNDYFTIAKSLFCLCDAKSIEDNNLLEDSWKEVDTWFVDHVLNEIERIGELSSLPIGLDSKWLNSSLNALCIDITKLNDYKVLPNQNGSFCKYDTLYKDTDIPEELKDDVFNEISLNYKNILLHPDIDAISITQKKGISDFAIDLNEKIESLRKEDSSKSAVERVALYMLSVLPKNNNSDVYEWQNKLYLTAREFLPEKNIIDSMAINYEAKDLWQNINDIIAIQICNKISSSINIDHLNDLLSNCGENHIFDLLNTFYDFVKDKKTLYQSFKIFPNQEGLFCKIKDLKEEVGHIEDILKKIISELVPKNENYLHILMDKRCRMQPQSELTPDSAYLLIDTKMHEYFGNQSNWTKESFIAASQLLIEEWGEKHSGLFEEKFPRIYPNREKILMNVVWTKEKRGLMMTVNNKLTDNQIKHFIENIDILKGLSDENEKLRKENEELKRLNNITIQGESPSYGGLTVVGKGAALAEAKEAVLDKLSSAGYDISSAKWDGWTCINGVKKNGVEYPLVVHSNKSGRNTSLTPLDWNQLMKPNAMLAVNTSNGVGTINFIEFLTSKENLTIRVHSNNFKDKKRILSFANAFRYFGGIQFDFESFVMPEIGCWQKFMAPELNTGEEAIANTTIPLPS